MTFESSLKIDRIGAAISPGDSPAVATWYSNGWKVWWFLRSTMMIWTGSPSKPRAALRPPKPPPTITTRGIRLLVMGSTNKIAEMAVGAKSFPQQSAPALVTESQYVASPAARRKSWLIWIEILIVFGLLEAVMWTPRSVFHSCLIVLEVVVVLWLGLQGYS